MPSHHETQHSPYSTEQLFNLVAGIERYPEFLPWCRAARILKKESEQVWLAELVISFKHLTESYISRVQLHPPTSAGFAAIEVDMVSGPFEHLVNHWKFSPHPGGGTDIDFFVDFEFRSRLLGKMIGPLFTRACNTMGKAFEQRAHMLYKYNPGNS